MFLHQSETCVVSVESRQFFERFCNGGRAVARPCHIAGRQKHPRESSRPRCQPWCFRPVPDLQLLLNCSREQQNPRRIPPALRTRQATIVEAICHRPALARHTALTCCKRCNRDIFVAALRGPSGSSKESGDCGTCITCSCACGFRRFCVGAGADTEERAYFSFRLMPRHWQTGCASCATTPCRRHRSNHSSSGTDPAIE